jgi:hypothetical protein
MTNAAATPDPIAAASAIVAQARRATEGTASTADHDGVRGTAAVAALGGAVIFSLIAIAAMITSPATIPLWCAAHGGCP